MRKIYLFDLGLLVLAGTIAAALTAKPVQTQTSSAEEIAGEFISCSEQLERVESGCKSSSDAPDR